MSIGQHLNRFREAVGSLIPVNQGKVYDEIDKLESEKKDAELLVSLRNRGEWMYVRYEINQRITQLTNDGLNYMADPRKFELQAVACSARRNELTQLLDIVENSPNKLEIIKSRLNELYEITRDWTSTPRQSEKRASNEGNQ